MADAVKEKPSVIVEEDPIFRNIDITRVISGGQTGADQAALAIAIEKGISYGGWIPKGRITEAGMLPEKYQLKEKETASYRKRTEQNVIDSDGTLIVSYRELTGGSAYTGKWPKSMGSPGFISTLM